MPHSISSASLAANIAESLDLSGFAGRTLVIGETPEVASLAIDEALADCLAWINDAESNDEENFPGPGWDDAGSYTPTTEDWEEYSRYLDTDRGYPADALTPDEMDLLAATRTEADFRQELLAADEAYRESLMF